MRYDLRPAALAMVLGLSVVAHAHNAVNPKEAWAGYSTSLELNVNHGCKGSPVVGLRLKIPDGVRDARAAFDPNWVIEYKYRKLEKPFEYHGILITEVVDEITWKDPVKVLPANGWYPFRFRMTIPDRPNEVLHFRNITVCEEGTEGYVDLPDQELRVDDPNWGDNVWSFMTATATPAPFLVIRSAPKKQYPWEWTTEQARGIKAH